MDVSVCSCTARLGGLDVLFKGLANQDFEGDFELVLADEAFDLRHEQVEKYMGNFDFDIQHIKVEPREGFTAASSANEAYRHARGKYVFNMGDWSFVPPNYITTGLDILNKYPLAICGFTFVTYKPPKLDLPLDPHKHGISCLKEPFDETTDFEEITRMCNTPAFAVRQLDQDRYVIPWRTMQGLLAMERQTLYNMNGYDEVYDGNVGYMDFDLLYRMALKGHLFVTDVTCTIKRFRFGPSEGGKDKRALMYGKNITVTDGEINRAIFEKKMRDFKDLKIVRYDAFKGIFDRRGWKEVRFLMSPMVEPLASELRKRGYILHDNSNSGYEYYNVVVLVEEGADFGVAKVKDGVDVEKSVLRMTEDGCIRTPSGREITDLDDLDSALQSECEAVGVSTVRRHENEEH